MKRKSLYKKVIALGLAMGMIFIGKGMVWADEVTSAPAVDSATENTVASTEKERLEYAVAPSGMVLVEGNICLADSSANVIRMRKSDGTYQTIAGQENVSGNQNGEALKASFAKPWDIVAYKSGYAISDADNNSIRLLKNGKVSNLVSKKLNNPTGLAVGAKGELYIADTGNDRILVLDKNGKLKVFAGSGNGCKDGTLRKAKFSEPTALCYYKKALYVADSGNHRIVKIANAKVTTIAGSTKGIEGDTAGKAKNARFSNPQGIVIKNNVVYIADTGNGSVKKLEKGKVTPFVEAFSLKGDRTPAQPRGMVIKGSTLFIGDVYAEDLLKKKL